jgi:hypothetical protein
MEKEKNNLIQKEEIKDTSTKVEDQPIKTTQQIIKAPVVEPKAVKRASVKPKAGFEPQKQNKLQVPVAAVKAKPAVTTQTKNPAVDSKKACGCNASTRAAQNQQELQVPQVSIDKNNKICRQEEVSIGKLNKKIPKSRLALARVYAKLDESEKAKIFYKQMIELEPNVCSLSFMDL